MNKIIPAIVIAVVALSALWFTWNRGQKQTLREPELVSVTKSGTPSEVVQEPAQAVKPVHSEKTVKNTPAKVAPVQTEVAIEEVAPELKPIPEGIVALETPIQSSVLSTSDSELVTTHSHQKLTGNFFLSHMVALQKGNRAFSELGAGIGYQSGPSRIAVFQEAKKLYEIAARGENEFLLSDTVVAYDYDLSDDFGGFQWKLNAGATLPVSKNSQDNKHITRPSLGLEISRSFFDKRLKASYQPAFSYYFNRYATNGAGVPIEKMSFGQSVQVSFEIIPESLSIVGWGKGYFHGYEEFDFTKTSPANTTSYAYGSYLAYNVVKNVSLQAGYLRGNSLLVDPRYDSVYYDAPTHRGYAAIVVGF